MLIVYCFTNWYLLCRSHFTNRKYEYEHDLYRSRRIETQGDIEKSFSVDGCVVSGSLRALELRAFPRDSTLCWYITQSTINNGRRKLYLIWDSCVRKEEVKRVFMCIIHITRLSFDIKLLLRRNCKNEVILHTFHIIMDCVRDQYENKNLS